MNKDLLKDMISAVEEQIETNNPEETKLTYNKLLDKGYTSNKAKELLAEVIYQEAMEVIKTQEPFNRERYINNLNKLSKTPNK